MKLADMSRAGLGLLRGGLDSPTFVWKNLAIPCVPNTLSTQAEPEVGGYSVSIGFKLFVDAREFFSADTTAVTVDSDLYTVDDDRPVPASGKLVQYNGKSYRVESARLSPDRAFLVFSLIDRNK